MNVFPENMNKINTDDPKTGLKQLEQQLRYIRERVDFSMRSVVKTVSSNITTAEVQEQLRNMRTELTQALSTINTYSARINTLEAATSNLNTETASLRTELADAIADLESLSSTVSGIETDIDTIEGNISTIQDALQLIDDAFALMESDVSTLQQTVDRYVPASGSGAPTSATEGTPGQIYIDTAKGAVYILLSSTEAGGVTTYNWVQLSTITPEPEPEPGNGE